jgi:hypothetical protein
VLNNDMCSLCRKSNCNISGGAVLTIVCPVCGTYKITSEARSDLPQERKLLDQLVKVSSYTRHRTINQMEPVTLFLEDEPESSIRPRTTIQEVIDSFPRLLSDRIDRALINIAKMSKFSGDRVNLKQEDHTVFYPDSNDLRSAYLIFGQLVGDGLISGHVGFSSEVTVTVKGWNRIYEIEKGINLESKQAFIAMWFNTEMNSASENGFKRAIRDAGFEPIRVDDREHNGKIDDQIIAEIRRSKFVVCDFTGHRGGVYFEAGFAMGLGLPVIWCCRKDHFADIHFDTRQYNHISWTDEEDLYNQLFNRIRATIL